MDPLEAGVDATQGAEPAEEVQLACLVDVIGERMVRHAPTM